MVVRIRPALLFRFGTAALLCTVAWGSSRAAESGVYDITARTEMPHLEENLRYATVRERRCVRELASLFPILQHPSLEGCRLAGDLLVCTSPEVATGSVRLDEAPGQLTGVLEVKMGGKNMTFAQRVEAVRLGDCEPAR
jgi:hypothetical protein